VRAAIVVTPGRLEIAEIPEPKPGPNEALVRVEACGICGTTDRHIVAGRQAHHPSNWYPAVLGHEALGTVIAVGEQVRKFRVGDRVTRPVAVWPGTSPHGYYSAWGGFAQMGVVRESAAADYTADRQHVVPSDLSLEQAVMAISISEVASWMEKLGDLKDRTVLIGGTGFAACVMAQCARAASARHIIGAGRSPRKFDWLRRNGATDVVSLDAAKEEVRRIAGRGADFFLDAAGHQSVFEIGLTCLRPGGTVAIYGAPEGFAYRLPLGSVGGDFAVRYIAPEDDRFFVEACRRIGDGRLDAGQLQSHQWDGLDSLGAALAKQDAGEVLKSIVRI